jgi:hypothetical protein
MSQNVPCPLRPIGSNEGRPIAKNPLCASAYRAHTTKTACARERGRSMIALREGQAVC